jgi:hypothetical protein
LEEKAMRANLKKKITGFVFIVAACLTVSQLQAVEFAGGTGEPNVPYQIATAEQLKAIGDSTLYDKNFVLVADIDLDPNLPGNEIVVDRSFISFFSGTLDGNGHSISNLVIGIYSNAPGGPRTGLGLIGFLSRDGIIKDILLRNITICGVGHQVGALVGSNYGTVLRCSATGNISGVFGVGGLVGRNGGSIVSCSAFCNVVQGETVAGGAVAGGLVGDNFGYIYNCYATGTVTGKGALGGLVGINYDGMSNCYATGTVTGEESVGGLAGSNVDYIYNCYAIGTVTGEESVGGLVGANYADTVSQCYAASKIITDSNDSIGGLIGESIGQTTNSFWDIQVSGLKTSASGIGLPTLKLQDSATYLNAGWDMAGETSNGVADFWTIMEPNTYPQLTRLTEQYTVKQLPGSGTPYDPYEIATAADLVAINDYDINAHYILVADIDMSGIVWATAPILFFNGTFDGRGNTISNLTIKGSDYLGLFGKIRHRAVVTNLTIQDAYIIGNECVGALAGQSIGQITNCHVTGNVTGVSYVGGLVGLVYGATFEETISDCTADVALSGNDNIHNIANARYFD